MTGAPTFSTWQAIRAEVLRRITDREWPPGAAIPHEAELAREFGCARATVNRALREIADEGLIERRRRAGSRVALHPVLKATLRIPVLRKEVEARGAIHRFRLLTRTDRAAPPPDVSARFLGPAASLLHLTGLHLADERPYAVEDRWIDTGAVPEAAATDFTRISPNEWLVANVPLESGTLKLSAAPASPLEAELLDCAPGVALFVLDRATRRAGATLTIVRLAFAEGYTMETDL